MRVAKLSTGQVVRHRPLQKVTRPDPALSQRIAETVAPYLMTLRIARERNDQDVIEDLSTLMFGGYM